MFVQFSPPNFCNVLNKVVVHYTLYVLRSGVIHKKSSKRLHKYVLSARTNSEYKTESSQGFLPIYIHTK